MIRLLEGLRGLRGAARFFTLLLAGAAAALALPPLDLSPVLAFAVLPLLLAFEGLQRGAWRAAFLCGWAFGLGYFIVAFHWIAYAFFVDAATYLWMMPFAVGGLAAAMAVYWGLAGMAAGAWGLRGLPLVVAFAVALGLGEDLRGRLFTGFPWAAPGLAVAGMGATAQAAALLGMTGLTLLIVLWAGLPLAIGRGLRQGVMALLLLALLPLLQAYGAWRLSQASDAMVPGVSLRIVQPDVSQDVKWRDDHARSIFDQLKALSAAASAARPDGIASVTHLIWPESAVPFLIDESPVAREELAVLLGGRTQLVTGALRRNPAIRDAAGWPAVYNSMVAFDGKGKVEAIYDKWRLVPGGEFLPFERLLEPLGFRKVVTVPGSFAAGPGPTTLRLPGAPPVAMLICYEIVFPHDLVAANDRPSWILNVTNDGWFDGSTGPAQHLAQARLRAIEQGLPVVRAANTGISAVIDGYGRLLHRLPARSAGVIDAPLPAALAAPPYARHPDAALVAMALVLLSLVVIGVLVGRRSATLHKSPASSRE